MAPRLLILLACVIAASFLGPTAAGVSGWHEGQRLLVAQQMHARWLAARQAEPKNPAAPTATSPTPSEALLVPRIHGRAYIAKPPVFYWCIIAVTEARAAIGGERRVMLIDLRLTIALAGLLGVLATFFSAKELAALRAPRPPPHDHTDDQAHDHNHDRHALDTGLIAGLLMAAGILSVRSTRIGELDILLVPTVTAAVWMLARAWRTHLLEQRTSIAAVLIATTLAGVAALVKGPPAIAVIAIGAFGGMLLWAANTTAPIPQSIAVPRLRAAPERKPRPTPPAARQLAIAAGVGTALFFALPQIDDEPLRQLIGALIGTAMLATVFASLAGLVRPERARAALAALSRTHPLIVLLVPVLLAAGWALLVRQLVGQEAADAFLSDELDDNLRPFRPESPISILEAAAYGVFPAAVLLALGIVWARKKTLAPLGPGVWIALAWTLGGLALFSLFGKGLGRYLTPVWPGMAILAAMLLVCGPWYTHHRTRTLRIAVAAAAALALGQGLWYGVVQPRVNPDDTPRDFVRELITQHDTPPEAVLQYRMSEPVLSYYIAEHGRDPAAPIAAGDIGARIDLTGVRGLAPDELRDYARQRGSVVLLTQDRHREAMQQLARTLGLEVQEIQTEAGFALARGDHPVRAYRLTPMTGNQAPVPPPPADR